MPQSEPRPWPPAGTEQPPSLGQAPPGRAQHQSAPPQGGAGQKLFDRSRRLRTQIGVISIIVGGFDLFGTAIIAALLASHPDMRVFAGVGNALVIFGAVQGLAYIGIGIWSLVTRRSAERGPLVSTLILTSIGILLGVLDIAGGISSGKMPQLGSYVLVVVLFQRSIAALRLKPASSVYTAP